MAQTSDSHRMLHDPKEMLRLLKASQEVYRARIKHEISAEQAARRLAALKEGIRAQEEKAAEDAA